MHEPNRPPRRRRTTDQRQGPPAAPPPLRLLDTNLDLLTEIGADNDVNAIVMSEIYANRHATEALDRVFDTYSDTITTETDLAG